MGEAVKIYEILEGQEFNIEPPGLFSDPVMFYDCWTSDEFWFGD